MNSISLHKAPNLRILCHEFAHHLDFTLRHKTRHDAFMADLVDEVCEYVCSYLGK